MLEDLEEARIELEENEKKIRLIINAIPDGVEIVDKDLNILWMNKKLLKEFGGDSVGKKCYEVYCQNKRQCEKCPLKNNIKPGESGQLLVEGIVGGKTFEITHTGIIFDGKQAILEIFRDVTEKRRAFENLKKSEEKYATVVNSAYDSISIVQNGKLVFTNKATSKITGYSKKELMGMSIMNLVAKHDRALIKKRYRDRLLGKKTPNRYEFDAVKKNGMIIHVEIAVQKTSYDGGEALMVIIRDITKRKKGEKALEDAKHRAEAIIESVGEGLFVTDKLGVITAVNKTALALIGEKKKNVIGKKYASIFKTTDEMGEASLHAITSAIKKSNVENRAFTGTRLIYLKTKKHVGTVPISICVAPVINGGGKSHGSVVVFKDISEERRLSRAETEFVSSASHQLNTPLGAIKLLTESLINEDYGKVNQKQKEYLNLVQNSTTRMIRLVHELLDVSRLEASKLQIKLKKVNIDSLVKEVIQESDALAKSEGQKIVFTSKLQTKKTTETDKLYFSQVIKNLISNALYYSPKSSKVFVDIYEDKKAKEYIISVKDSGIGIPKIEQKNIFQKFFRTDDAKKSRTDGSGLGLYVGKSLVESLGGRIWFESKGKGKGSVFYVTIPIR